MMGSDGEPGGITGPELSDQELNCILPTAQISALGWAGDSGDMGDLSIYSSIPVLHSASRCAGCVVTTLGTSVALHPTSVPCTLIPWVRGDHGSLTATSLGTLGLSKLNERCAVNVFPCYGLRS